MPQVGFFEIVTVCIVALLVLGPDKLPGTVRTVGLWVGRLKRSFNNIKSEIEKEVGADEIRRQLRNEEIMEKIKSTQKDFSNTVESVKKEVTDAVKPEGMDELKSDFDSIAGKKPLTEGNKTHTAKPEPSPSESDSETKALPETTPEPKPDTPA